ncbi:MAG TPA: glycosyltransferase family 39 protein [Flavisolibacter sp.]|nr:glycosyltransferase family 39 protein [Flavisolibacter sp.]
MTYVQRNRWTLSIVFLLVLYCTSVLVHLGVLEFSGEEPRRAMVSVEMINSGNYIRPLQYGWDYYNKPPFFNWILAGLILITGSVSEFVLRLPSVVFYLLMGFVHYRVARHFFPKQVAAISSFFLVTCADVYTYGLAYGVEIDIFYSFVVYLQAISMFWFYTKRKLLPLFLVSYFFCAVGFLTKGFPSLLFQVLTLAALCVQARSFRLLFRWQHLAGIAVFVAITGTYFLLYSNYASPVRYLINLLNEATLKSGIGKRSNRLFDKAIVYPWLFVKMFAPWSLLLLLLISKVKYHFRQNPLVWFSLLFMLFNIGVYWFTGQPKIRYVYMFLPFGCTVLAYIYHRYTEVYASRFNSIMKYVGGLFVLPLLTVLVLPFIETVSPGWIISLAIAFLLLLFQYYRKDANRIWLFIAGFMLVRLTYAALFIPIQYKGIESYNAKVKEVLAKTHRESVQYWAKAKSFPIAVKTSLFSYEAETILKPEILPLELPYYYYRNTGKIIEFDTVKRNSTCFVSYLGQLGNKKIDTVYAYFDKNLNQRVVFYHYKE